MDNRCSRRARSEYT